MYGDAEGGGLGRAHRPPRLPISTLCKVALARRHIDADEAAFPPYGLQQRGALGAPG